MSLLTSILIFLLLTIVILIAGARLSYYADVIALKTGLGRIWIGIILLATITSLPELMNSITAVSIFKAPDLAVGNIFGACTLNIMIIAFLDLYYRKGAFLSKVDQGHILSASFSVFLYTFIAYFFVLENLFELPKLAIGLYSVVIILVYFLAIRLIFRFEYKKVQAFPLEVTPPISLKKAFFLYFFLAFIVIVASMMLPGTGERIAQLTGISTTFVGTLFIAISTTLPETVITLSAVRLGAFDLAIANILGSNLFNILILAVADFFFLRGPLLQFSNRLNFLTLIAAIAMTILIVASLVYRARPLRIKIDWTSPLIILIYIVNACLVYILS